MKWILGNYIAVSINEFSIGKVKTVNGLASYPCGQALDIQVLFRRKDSLGDQPVRRKPNDSSKIPKP